MDQASFQLEIKSISGRRFSGYGSVFGNVDLGGDVVLPGAFRKSLARHKGDGTMPLMFWMHKSDEVPGVWLDMGEDKDGLGVEGEIIDTSLGKDVLKLMEKKAVRGLSIGYQPVEVDWRDDGVRLLKQVELHEVSIVSMAMNPLAKIEALKARLSADGEYVPTAREFEESLRNAGYSRKVSLLLTAKLFDGVDGARGNLADPQRDSGADEKLVFEALMRLTDKIGAQALPRF